jgi:hypothetical protein
LWDGKSVGLDFKPALDFKVWPFKAEVLAAMFCNEVSDCCVDEDVQKVIYASVSLPLEEFSLEKVMPPASLLVK